MQRNLETHLASIKKGPEVSFQPLLFGSAVAGWSGLEAHAAHAAAHAAHVGHAATGFVI